MGEEDIVKFLVAAKKGDLKAVQGSLASGIDVDSQDVNLGSAMYQAVVGRHNELLTFLVDEAKADVNKAMFNFQFTPLIASVVSNNYEAFKFIISKAETDVNVQNKTGDTALMFAVKYTRNVMAQELVNHVDIDLSLTNSMHRTALMDAVVVENDKIVNMILAHKYSYADFKNHEGKSALNLAQSCKNKAIKVAIEDATLDHFRTPIGVAVKGKKMRQYCEKLFSQRIREISDLSDKIDDKFLSWTCSIENERDRQRLLQLFDSLRNAEVKVVNAEDVTIVAEAVVSAKGSEVPFAKVVP